jgi:arylsulfatase A-like enzyme
LLDEVDRAVGDVLEIARQRRREFVLVITADHGELLGEHGGFAHAGGFVPELLDIPFVVMDSRSAVPQRRCELLLSSDAMRHTVLEIQQVNGMEYPDHDPLELDLPPLGHATIRKSTSTIEYEVSSGVMPHAGTWRNIHHERRGTITYPVEQCSATAR